MRASDIWILVQKHVEVESARLTGKTKSPSVMTVFLSIIYSWKGLIFTLIRCPSQELTHPHTLAKSLQNSIQQYTQNLGEVCDENLKYIS